MQASLLALTTVLSLGLSGAPQPAVQGEEEGEPSGALWLVLEAPAGTTRRIRPGAPALEDPRSEGAWAVRVVGAPPAREAEDDTRPRAEVTLVGGDRLRGRIVGGAGEVLQLELVGGVALPLALESIASLVIRANLPALLAAPLVAPDEGDRIYRRTGGALDRDDGALLGFEADGLLFESALLGERSVPWDALGALFIEVLDAGGSETPAAGVAVIVDLADASRVRGRFMRLDADGLRLAVGESTPLELPLEQVAEIVVDDGTIAFLSDLEPFEEEGRGAPFGDELGLVLPHRLDRAATGGPLLVGGERFARGIGMHAPSRVRWRLGSQWTHLRGSVGIDDSTQHLPRAARGSVVFRVRLDGALLWESLVVRGGDASLAMPALALPAGDGARVLELEAEAYDDFRGDRADWLRLVLFR